jgi:putative transposase
LAIVEHAQRHDPQASVVALCQALGLSRATLYRWRSRHAQGRFADQLTRPVRPSVEPTPEEGAAVCAYAQAHPLLGYKRLTWAMVDEDVAWLRPWQVYQVLATAGLLGRRQPAPEGLRRPAAADHPDQRWHTDLMSLFFAGRWFWLIDVLDAYSRYLVHGEVWLTARADGVQLAGQRALDTLGGHPRQGGEPEIVHDGGPQFLGHEWRWFGHQAGLTDMRTMAYHPQSNGRDARLHRTIRAEVPLDAEDTRYQVVHLIASFRRYYNEQRPHSALHDLRPRDYYRGNPAERLAEREAKLRQAAEARKRYWHALRRSQ